TNWSRGGAARGASTITQQLAKNLFLSRDKQLGRKLQELAITFLLESALGKDRILEIYLNIIEWGPDLRGLRPAAQHYFGREPQALTPAQMAFLVAIIPGPIKYQRSFARGTPGPGLRSLIDDLLEKLRSVQAISEEEYQRALSEPIIVPSDRLKVVQGRTPYVGVVLPRSTAPRSGAVPNQPSLMFGSGVPASSAFVSDFNRASSGAISVVGLAGIVRDVSKGNPFSSRP